MLKLMLVCNSLKPPQLKWNKKVLTEGWDYVPSLIYLNIMLKIYKANTVLSINVMLDSKKNKHIAFSPLSDGSSTFSTDDEDVQRAIERNHNFGKRFRLEKTINPEELAHSVADDKSSAAEKASVKRVKVSDIASAKDYLATNCGISRTVLRSEKSIIEQAAANGIEFYGMAE